MSETPTETVTVEVEFEVEQDSDGSMSFDLLSQQIGEGEYPTENGSIPIESKVSRFRESTEADIQTNFGNMGENHIRVFADMNELAAAAMDAVEKSQRDVPEV
jgi:hypothetical protein